MQYYAADWCSASFHFPELQRAAILRTVLKCFRFLCFSPLQYALHVYNEVMSVGQKYGIRNSGYYALRSLRIEKFFAFWGQDLDAFTTPLECGREFRVKLDKVQDAAKSCLGRIGGDGSTEASLCLQSRLSWSLELGTSAMWLPTCLVTLQVSLQNGHVLGNILSLPNSGLGQVFHFPVSLC